MGASGSDSRHEFRRSVPTPRTVDRPGASPEPSPGRFVRATWGALLALLTLGAGLEAQSLRGGTASMDRQNQQARAHDFTFLQTASDVRRFVAAGYLVPMEGNANLRVLESVSFPYARPAARLFLERLSEQYRGACGERLVVTSLTRPDSHQPPNASPRSVHPTGMAIDLRVSHNRQCRSWLESVLVSLQREGVVEAIRERRPPHYHVVVFPDPYLQYVTRVAGEEEAARARVAAGPVDFLDHPVRPGETLTSIAREHEISVNRLRAANGLNGDRIFAGQTLQVPVQTAAATISGEDGGVAEYTVRRGDTLIGIAREYGVSVDRLRGKNDLRGDRINAGEVLRVPLGAN